MRLDLRVQLQWLRLRCPVQDTRGLHPGTTQLSVPANGRTNRGNLQHRLRRDVGRQPVRRRGWLHLRRRPLLDALPVWRRWDPSLRGTTSRLSVTYLNRRLASESDIPTGDGVSHHNGVLGVGLEGDLPLEVLLNALADEAPRSTSERRTASPAPKASTLMCSSGSKYSPRSNR